MLETRNSPSDDNQTRDARGWYLKSHVKLEPLVCRWPAWPHLLAPGPQAMNAAFRHLPNLKSFVANPSIHIAAAADPAMLGGPFVGLSQADLGAARALLQRMSESCAQLLAFAQDYRNLNDRLQSGANGACLDEYYQALPASLAGLIELVYDLNHHPKIRLIEELLYESELGTDSVHEVCLHATPSQDRTFFMSTPLLDRPGRVFLDSAFRDSRLDRIARMRIAPDAPADVAKDFALSPEQYETFSGFFTREAPARSAPEYSGPDVRVRYFGHACVLVQTAQSTILIDPLTAWEREAQLATLTFDDLPDRVDSIVLTHCHQDHCVPEMLLQLRSRAAGVVVPTNDRGNLADPSMKLLLRRMGLSGVTALEPFESVQLPDAEIQSLPFSGEHAGLDINSKHCIVIRTRGRTLLFLVDSDGVDPALYRRLAARLGRIDAMFIGMECHGAPLTWLYGPLLGTAVTRRHDDSRRLSGSNAERAWAIYQALRPARVFIYAMGQEPWLKALMGLAYEPDSIQLREAQRFIDQCRDAGTPAERLFGCREMIF